jgi:hypothetical protein
MTGYSDILIPLLGGILFFFFPDIIMKNKDAGGERRRRTFKIVGIVLIGAAIVYFLIKLFASR